MSILTEWLTYGEKGEFSAFIARTNKHQKKVPSVVLIQEIWGVDAHVQEIAKRIAAEGYAVIAPELFSYQGMKPDYLQDDAIQRAKNYMDTTPKPLHKSEQINETLEAILGKFSRDRFPEIVKQAATFMRDTFPYSTGMGVVSVGFCLGGMLSAGLACEDPQLKGAVVFYGQPPEAHKLNLIVCPLLGFYGEQDTKITDLIPDFAVAMKNAGKSYEYHIFPETPHAFYNDTRPSYREEASQASFTRMLAFFKEVLR